MKSKLFVLNAAAVIGLSSILAAPAAYAESINSLENKKSQIQDQRSGLESKVNTANDKIKQLQDQQDKTRAEMKRIDLAIGETNTKIREKNEQITTTKAEIEKLKAEIVVLKERIAKRNDILKQRALTYQENGGKTNYLEVIFGASSFGDLIDRVSAVSEIMQADEALVNQHEADKKQLEETQQQVENKLASLESMKKDLESMKAKLSTQKVEKDKLMAQLEKEEKDTHTYKMSLEEEDEMLAAQQATISKAIALEKQRQKELEEARKKAAQQAALNNASSGGSGSSSSSNSGGSSSGGNVSNERPAISGGAFTRPAVGTLTSGFGGRWGAFHYGVDIANSADVPILAAADGIVARSYYSSSYGNAVFITHSINGQIYTTVYAHMESRMVSTGATVSKGQQIGIMGNTGESKGQHLHFELHKGSWTPSKSGAINPVGIVPL
ncbi:murein hydrolase activator EnvC family protein [Bacillus massiliigorillae]|uniref:murein hydrolase activator EnvC family protein n=1 Tax=Bacillus massiliigorillae TaxID=1243664 RepID=UPI0003A17CC6|nr:M23 family metallopeptidase [Bacillus massiliigorillae]